MRGWLTDSLADAKSLEVTVRPIFSHSNSLGNETIKDTAGCRAFNCTFIVDRGKRTNARPQSVIKPANAEIALHRTAIKSDFLLAVVNLPSPAGLRIALVVHRLHQHSEAGRMPGPARFPRAREAGWGLFVAARHHGSLLPASTGHGVLQSMYK